MTNITILIVLQYKYQCYITIIKAHSDIFNVQTYGIL